MRKIISPIRIVIYGLLILFSIFCLFPLFWLVLTSLKTNEEIFVNPWGLPATLKIGNYLQAIQDGHILRYFVNSVIVALTAVSICVVLSTMVSYAVTRMQWKLSKLVYHLFLAGMMIPVYAMIIPLFVMMNWMHLLNTYLAVIIPQIAIGFPMSIFIICGFMQSIPGELEEAAVMDGANIFQIFGRIIIPLCKSSIVTVAVVQFIGCWNDLLLPQIFLTNAEKMTLPVGLTEFQGRYSTNYVAMIAAVVITVIPSVVVYIFLHRNIMEGMVAGAVKG